MFGAGRNRRSSGHPCKSEVGGVRRPKRVRVPSPLVVFMSTLRTNKRNKTNKGDEETLLSPDFEKDVSDLVSGLPDNRNPWVDRYHTPRETRSSRKQKTCVYVQTDR